MMRSATSVIPVPVSPTHYNTHKWTPETAE